MNAPRPAGSFDAARAHVALFAALTTGPRPPCSDYGMNELFTSDDADDQKVAARFCRGCAHRTQCGDYALAAGEAAGVWGGLTVAARRRKGKGRKPA